MTDVTLNRIAQLEQRIAELERFKKEIEGANFPLFVAEIVMKMSRLESQNKGAYESLFDHQKLFEVHGDMFADIYIDLSRLMEAYYKVFPERSEQDLKFQRQLDRIKSLRAPNSKD